MYPRSKRHQIPLETPFNKLVDHTSLILPACSNTCFHRRGDHIQTHNTNVNTLITYFMCAPEIIRKCEKKINKNPSAPPFNKKKVDHTHPHCMPASLFQYGFSPEGDHIPTHNTYAKTSNTLHACPGKKEIFKEIINKILFKPPSKKRVYHTASLFQYGFLPARPPCPNPQHLRQKP